MESVCREYIPESSENHIPPLVGQDDLFRALEVELDHIDLIRNILPCPTYIKIFLGDGPTSLSSN